MAPDDKERLIIAPRLWKAKVEKPFHVSGHPPETTNITCPMLSNKFDRRLATITPVIPYSYFIVKSHKKNTKIKNDTKYKMIL